MRSRTPDTPATPPTPRLPGPELRSLRSLPISTFLPSGPGGDPQQDRRRPPPVERHAEHLQRWCESPRSAGGIMIGANLCTPATFTGNVANPAPGSGPLGMGTLSIASGTYLASSAAAGAVFDRQQRNLTNSNSETSTRPQTSRCTSNLTLNGTTVALNDNGVVTSTTVNVEAPQMVATRSNGVITDQRARDQRRGSTASGPASSRPAPARWRSPTITPSATAPPSWAAR